MATPANIVSTQSLLFLTVGFVTHRRRAMRDSPWPIRGYSHVSPETNMSNLTLPP